ERRAGPRPPQGRGLLQRQDRRPSWPEFCRRTRRLPEGDQLRRRPRRVRHEHRTQDVGVAPHRKEVVTNMQNLIARARRWLTIERRQAIYAAVAAVVPILVYAGLLSSGAVEHIMTLTQVTIQILA